ncbi:MAG: tetratricopeptide repeat protein [Spirochaetes bacterium]|nr:tetratricopeptide repeat protein [Spirochaetota bacterium]
MIGLWRVLLFLLFFLGPGVIAQTQTAFQEGERFFLNNNPRSAIPLLEQATIQEPRNERIYLYLGIAYEQIGNYDQAIRAMKRGLEFALQYKDLFYFNLGNNHLAKGETETAIEMYTKALETNGSLADAFLNRANLEVKLDRLSDAWKDYSAYLNLVPDSPQRPQIERMMALIQSILQDREAKRIAEEKRRKEEEEARRIAEERRRQEEERRRQEEEARQKALLEAVLSSLKASTEGVGNLSAEKEDIREKRIETDIEE